MPLDLLPYDASACLVGRPEEQASLLSDALATNDPDIVAGALALIARAQGVSAMARETGLSREAIYKATRKDGNPRLSTLIAMLKSAGIKLTATAA
ncbi:addiction module antidote protein [Sandaracinobacteroides saxicola]|uniref:Putative addiction module antidote protein n=1 Tax=Sandaracinobacteroides saxicola TaxID=2759707 RepID=A0A7G5IGC2_9SPHN|nr:addiction module antidote protein [Sandaracinobacteroides saxicola]QMW22414.1 putative addiction module antidote protein [Sandaracinobacteroides saxicola]